MAEAEIITWISHIALIFSKCYLVLQSDSAVNTVRNGIFNIYSLWMSES